MSVPVPTLLAVWAHPDDEAYLAAGLLAAAADAGWRVVVATATRGEFGSDVPGAPDHVAVQRARELADSLAALGLTDHRWLRAAVPLHDGRLAGVPREAGIRAVSDLLDELAPDRVVTFGPDGITGHPDHRAVSGWTTAAWERIGRRADLWYAALTAEFLECWGALCAEYGMWMGGGPPEPADPDDLVHVQNCAGALLDRKFAALAAHASQTAELIERVGERRYRQWWSTEAFVVAAARPAAEYAAVSSGEVA